MSALVLRGTFNCVTDSGHLVYVTDRTRDPAGNPNTLIVRDPSGLEDVLRLAREGRFLHAASNPWGTVRAVLHDGDTARMRFAGPGVRRVDPDAGIVNDVLLLMPAAGQNGCLIRWEIERSAWQIVGMDPDGRSYWTALVNDAGDFVELPERHTDVPAAIAREGTSQGWLGFAPDGALDWTDLRRIVDEDDARLGLPARSADVVAGQHGDELADPPEQLLAIDVAGRHTIALGQVFETHVAGAAVSARMDGWTIAYTARAGGDYIAREPIPSVRVLPIGRPFACGPFFATSADASVLALEKSGHVETPGNLEIPINATAEQLARVTRPMIAPISCAEVLRDDQILAIYCHIGGADDPRDVIAAVRPYARSRGKGLVIYQDTNQLDDAIQGVLEPGDVVSPKFYPLASERLINLRRRLTGEIVRLLDWRVPILPAIATYTMGGRISDANLARLVALYAELACEWPQILGMVWFAWLRADGVALRPWLAELLAQFAAGVPALPAWPPVAGPRPPTPPPPAPIPPAPIPPADDEDDMRPIYPQEKFEQFIDAATDRLMPFYPQAPREHIWKSCEGAGNRVRACGVNPTVRDLVFGAAMALGTGEISRDKREAGTDHVDAVVMDQLLRDCLADQERLRPAR